MGRDFRFRHQAQGQEGVVKLVRVANRGPGLGADLPNGVGIQIAEVAGLLGQDVAPGPDGAGPPFLQGRVVQKGIRVGIEDLVAEGRRFPRIHGRGTNVPALDSRQDLFQALDVRGLGEAVVKGLLDQRMIGNGDIALDILLTGGLFRKHGSQQIVGPHAL